MIKKLFAPDDGSGGGGEGTPQGNALTIEIDGESKTVTPDDVVRIMNDNSTMTAKAEKIEKILTAAQKYDLDPEEYVAQAEGGFGVINKLIEEGIIDEHGDPVKGQKTPQGEPPPKGADPNDLKLNNADGAVLKAIQSLQGTVEAQNQKLAELERDNLGLMRLRMQDKLQTKYPGLDEEDVSRVLGAAMNDKSMSVDEHAKNFMARKEEANQAAVKAWAKKHNIDLGAMEELNKIREQEAEGGAGALYKEKKFSFRGGKKAVTPKQAAQEYFERNLGGK